MEIKIINQLHRFWKSCLLLLLLGIGIFINVNAQSTVNNSWIRINLLGYPVESIKIAVYCTKTAELPDSFEIIDAITKLKKGSFIRSKDFGSYGPFKHCARIDFSSFVKPGKYYLRYDHISSPIFTIADSVYNGAADFCLRYMRQQRNGFNPSINDSCHNRDGYTLYGPMPDSTHIDVVGGWHDASDYLQYSTTSANATWHLLAAFRDFPNVFKDYVTERGIPGKNKVPDILDEARWGLNWLLKMNPEKNILFNQIGDDRDHIKMRLPGLDTNYYGRGFERPVYFVSGKPQQRGKFMNNTNGVSSIAGKFASSFSLGAKTYSKLDDNFSQLLNRKAKEAYTFGKAFPGTTQTASVRSPYIYAEENWVDDMELAAAFLSKKQEALEWAAQEPISPWLGKDTANHYQWYPFINLGHYELAKNLEGPQRNIVINYYKKGIEQVWDKAKNNAFYRGIPFIWCSNNLTVSFAIQNYWYRQLSHDQSFAALEQANWDWLLGCNPWGSSMIYGLPSNGDYPQDPHSAFTHIGKMPLDGGLVDGPVYTSIYKNLIGIQLFEPDEYATFQSDLAVYHDDYGDYSTNEPTMDGTASLIYLMAAKENEATLNKFQYDYGAITKGNPTKKEIALIFTGDEYYEGLATIKKTLDKSKVKAGFFLTGRMYRNKAVQNILKIIYQQHHYMGPHSDQHLLYNAWEKRDSMLLTKDSLLKDLYNNYKAMNALGISFKKKYFIPPYEWWNQQIADWVKEAGIQLFNFSYGTRTNADYTYPEMGSSYQSTDSILKKLYQLESAKGLNGSIILIHIGTDQRRKDKLYNSLSTMIRYLKAKGYRFKRIDELLIQHHD